MTIFYVELPIKNVEFTSSDIPVKGRKQELNKSEMNVLGFAHGENTKVEIKRLFIFEDSELSPIDASFDDIFLKANFGLGRLFIITVIGFHCLDDFDGILEYVNGKFERVL